MDVYEGSTSSTERSIEDSATKVLEKFDEKCQENKSVSRHWRTFAATLVAVLPSYNIGMVFGYTSSAVPDVNAHPNPFHLTAINIAVVCSSFAVGGLLGQICCGFLSDKFGRRQTLIFNCVPTVVGWVLLGCAPNAACMYVGRVLTGFSGGISDVTVPVYISEISEKSVRGFMFSCHELFVNIGLLYVFALGVFIHWNWLAIACSAVPVVTIALLPLVPESPRWLLANARKEEALAALLWLRCDSPVAVELELQEIEENLRTAGTIMQWSEWVTPSLIKPVFIVVGLLFFQQMSGYGLLSQYMANILQSAGSSWNPDVQATIVGCSGVISNVISGLVVDRAGRRTMLFVSSVIMTTGLAGLASFFSLKFCGISDVILSSLSWLPICGIIVYNFGVSLGYGTIPFYLSSEMLPMRARCKAGSFSVATSWVFTFVTSFTHEFLVGVMGNVGLCWLFCGFAFFGILFVYLVPETKGLSLEEMESVLNKKSGNNNLNANGFCKNSEANLCGRKDTV